MAHALDYTNAYLSYLTVIWVQMYVMCIDPIYSQIYSLHMVFWTSLPASPQGVRISLYFSAHGWSHKK
ncbi:hypothetical protein CLU79DRAFT_767894 [Phycomyces nitens]|nr:hypothetical protein CLU79DRAFT_767894 [Phycomyces nitens]